MRVGVQSQMELMAKHGHVVKDLRLLRGTGSSGPLPADRWRVCGCSVVERSSRFSLPFASEDVCAPGGVRLRMGASLTAAGH